MVVHRLFSCLVAIICGTGIMVHPWTSGDNCGTYEVVDNDGSLDCDKCYPGTRKIADCTRNVATQCATCASGTYNDGCTKANECEECDLYCDDRYHVVVTSECTPEHNLLCDCKDNFYLSDDERRQKPQLPCKPHKSCEIGEGATKGTSTKDTTCTQCENGTFSDTKNNVDKPCIPLTKCKESQMLKLGNSSTDSMCRSLLSTTTGVDDIDEIIDDGQSEDYALNSNEDYYAHDKEETKDYLQLQQSRAYAELKESLIESCFDSNNEVYYKSTTNAIFPAVTIGLSVPGSLLAVAFIIALILFIMRRQRRKKKKKENRARRGSGSSQNGLVVKNSKTTVEIENGRANGHTTPAAKSTENEATVDNVQPRVPSPGSTLFKKEIDDTKSGLYLTTLATASQSVAVLRSDRERGTCFHVGSRYLFTCWHVVLGIIDGRSIDILSDPQCVTVVFDYDNDIDYRQDIYVLDKEKPLVWINQNLDVCVLALEAKRNFDGQIYLSRKPVGEFGDVPRLNTECFVSIVGHPDGKSRKVDESCEIIPHSKVVLNQTLGSAPPALYDGYDNKARLLYNAWLEYGSSGAPVFMQNHEKRAVVVAIHAKGFPNSKEDRNSRKFYTFEQGILISKVAKAMENEDKDLAQEIFGKYLSKLMSSEGPHF